LWKVDVVVAAFSAELPLEDALQRVPRILVATLGFLRRQAQLFVSFGGLEDKNKKISQK
jgi:hypothetical protein